MSKSTVTVSSKTSLREFFKILAEESVLHAREDLKQTAEEERMRQTSLHSDIKKLSKGKKEDDEVLDEEGETEDPDDVKKKKVVTQDKQKQPEKTQQEPAEKAPAEEVPDTSALPDEHQHGVTFSSIKDALNTIRSGRSLRDKEIRQQLKSYFKNLSDEEQKSMYSFLDGISKVLTMGLNTGLKDGSEKEDEDIDDDDDADEGDDLEAGNDDIQKIKNVKAAQPKTNSGEDTSPPIDVGKKQRTESLRLKIKQLMG